ncbi:hypothetical protein Dcae01_00832 [Deinococcus caeni]|jgi:hypothetical protein|uniref:Uncharacterized protein n=1 Tax=Deinococcus caeni TaxID=569127 RepID=A0ABP9U949_9DEIO
MDWARFTERVGRRRKQGSVLAAECQWIAEPAVPDLEMWLRESGFELSAGVPSKPLTRDAAGQFITDILSYSLVYDLPVGTFGKASALSAEFLDFFSDQARFFTNGTLVRSLRAANGGLGTWVSLTGATFDTGLLAIDSSTTRILWFLENS